MHDNGISAPFFPNFPLKRAIRERKRDNGSSMECSFALLFVKFVSVCYMTSFIRYLSVIPLVHEIIEQMLSIKASQKIYARLEELCKCNITPDM